MDKICVAARQRGYTHITFQRLCWWSAQCLGKVRRPPMEFGGGETTHCNRSQNTVCLFLPNRHIYCAIAVHIAIRVPETHPCLCHAKCSKPCQIHHQRCCHAIYAQHISTYFAGGRTSSGVGSMFWEKLVGLRCSLVEVKHSCTREACVLIRGRMPHVLTHTHNKTHTHTTHLNLCESHK